MTVSAAVVVATAGAVLLVGTAVGPVLARLPEPVDGAGKRPYATLGSRRFRFGCAGSAGAATALAWVTLPPALQPMWAVLATVGVLLVAIDAQTTWLPLRLTRVGWGAMAVAAVAALPLGADFDVLARTAAGAVVAGLLYGTVWFVSRGGFGFGDVRFAPLLGAATAASSWTMLLAALLAGSLLGGLHGLLRLAGGRRGSFPYAPAMLAGAYLACVVPGWLST